MNRTIVGGLILAVFCGVSLPAMADHPAVGYWLISTSQLAEEVRRDGDLTKVDEATLDKLAECHGYFKGTCDLWIHAGIIQFRIEAGDDGRTVTYSIGLSRSSSTLSALSQGKLVVAGEFTARDGWAQDKSVVVFKRLNLKR